MRAAPQGAAAGPQVRLAVGVVAGVALGTALLGHLAGLSGGTGPDPDLWVFAAWDARAGAGLPLPPLGPLVVAMASTLGGEVHATWLLASRLSLPLAAGTATLLALMLGAGRVGAAAAGLACLLLPGLAVTTFHAGPDALAALAFTGTAAAAARAARHPGPRATLLLALAMAAAVLARELGPLVALGAAAGLALERRRPLSSSLLVPALLLLAALSPPLLLGEGPWPPAWTWMARVTRAAGGEEVPREVPTWVLDPAGSALVPLALRRAAWTLTRQPEAWATLLLGLGAALHRRRLAVAGVLAAGTAALFVWSEPRHVVVLAPTALAALAAWTRGAGRLPRAAALLLALLVAGWGAARWRPALELAREQARDTARLRVLGDAICAAAAPGDLAAGEPRAFLFCPLPRTVLPATPSAAAWHAWVAGEAPEGPHWARVPLDSERYPLFRLRPDLAGAARPCARSAPPPDNPRFPAPPALAPMDPPCEADPAAPVAVSPQGLRQRLLRDPPSPPPAP